MKVKNKKWIGVDVGGSKILLQVFNEQGKVLKTVRQPTITTKGCQGFLKQLYSLIDPYVNESLAGLGVAVPGIVDIHKGVLVKAPHLPTGRNLPLRSLLKTRYKVPVHIENDINAFLAAEWRQPRLVNYKNILALMIGTGVGGAVLVNGQILYGKNGFAGEMGHIITQADAKADTLEKQIGGVYSKKKVNYSKVATALAIGLSNFNLIFNPEAIVLGGSVYLHHLASHKKMIEKYIRAHSLDGKSPKLFDAKNSTSVAYGVILLLQKTQR